VARTTATAIKIGKTASSKLTMAMMRQVKVLQYCLTCSIVAEER
jgi:hypothetical protein